MNAEMELHDIIYPAVKPWGGTGLVGASSLAARQILAAGYSRPRMITAAEELDALPGGTVIRDSKGVTWQRYMKVLDEPVWFAATRDTGFYFDSNLTDDNRLPATVIYSPEES